MTTDLPQMSGREVMQVLARDGWIRSRQKGGHVTMKRPNGRGRVIVPDHPGDLKEGTLRSILKQAGLSVERFNELRRE